MNAHFTFINIVEQCEGCDALLTLPSDLLRIKIVLYLLDCILPVMFGLGMGRYEKYEHRDFANAKPYRIRDSAF